MLSAGLSAAWALGGVAGATSEACMGGVATGVGVATTSGGASSAAAARGAPGAVGAWGAVWAVPAWDRPSAARPLRLAAARMRVRRMIYSGRQAS